MPYPNNQVWLTTVQPFVKCLRKDVRTDIHTRVITNHNTSSVSIQSCAGNYMFSAAHYNYHKNVRTTTLRSVRRTVKCIFHLRLR